MKYCIDLNIIDFFLKVPVQKLYLSYMRNITYKFWFGELLKFVRRVSVRRHFPALLAGEFDESVWADSFKDFPHDFFPNNHLGEIDNKLFGWIWVQIVRLHDSSLYAALHVSLINWLLIAI